MSHGPRCCRRLELDLSLKQPAEGPIQVPAPGPGHPIQTRNAGPESRPKGQTLNPGRKQIQAEIRATSPTKPRWRRVNSNAG
jgi:hypothetical protein